MANVAFRIGQTPEQAVEFLRQKKMLAAKVFTKDLKESALARAATIARLSSAEMTKDIYQSLETAMREGKPLHQWKKELVGEFERKGWLAGHDKKISKGIDGKLLADPKTGEYFGTPRRLNTIYRVNMQAAYSAARYQRLRDNVDNRPYWQYSAVGDARTRPAHLALSGKIYRYDDPFWTTFYPPNGFNCRCTVIALSDRDLARRGIDEVGDSSEFWWRQYALRISLAIKRKPWALSWLMARCELLTRGLITMWGE
ncbi:SPP1 family phage head morphogenesis protein [Haemophilus parahaemolyticus]|uniref:SPP1 family phage head morphogenesis protein n=1 Tax=Haemophilus parahaemolyticus TaxID=735 RepID=A0A377I2J5_HAEPH|nr:SPP1 family phage head morphogenesis protein [Haemophilus parahaemolyticus]